MMISLPGRLVREDPPLVHLPAVSSTQNWLKNQFEVSSFPYGTAVFADTQTSGRGRPGNKWHHSPGNLAMSIWMPELPEGMSFPWTILTAHSVLMVLEKAVGRGFGIKYPNDIYLLESQLKVGGILVEALRAGGYLIGIGLNRDPPELPDAGGMVMEGRPLPPDPISLPLLIQDSMMSFFSGRVGVKDIMPFLEERLLWLGEWITWSEGGKPKMGKLLGLDDDGQLRVFDSQSGEVLLPVTVRGVRRITP